MGAVLPTTEEGAQRGDLIICRAGILPIRREQSPIVVIDLSGLPPV